MTQLQQNPISSIYNNFEVSKKNLTKNKKSLGTKAN